MSSTRHAAPDSPLRQERWASSIAIDRGIKSNLVALRLRGEFPMEDRESIWFLQNPKPGWIPWVAKELIARYPEHVTERSLYRDGIKAGQILDAAQVQHARWGMGGGLHSVMDQFLVRGELSRMEKLDCEHDPSRGIYGDESQAASAKAAAAARPLAYSADDFMAKCREEAAASLATHLTELCLNPALTADVADPWYFQDLLAALRRLRAEYAQRQPAGVAATSVCAEMEKAFAYASRVGGIVVVEGPPGIGKTSAAKAACERWPGRYRYFEVKPRNDRLSFFRAIASGLGTPACLKAKAQEIELRVEETLRTQDLVAVFDDALLAWPNTNLRESMPDRIDWIVLLAEAGVPVVLISTAQFWQRMDSISGRGAWQPDAFLDRCRHVKLPDVVPPDDFVAVVRAQVPQVDSETIKFLTVRAASSAQRGRNLRTLERMIRDAREVAKDHGRDCPSLADAREGVEGITLRGDKSLINAIAEARQPTPSRPRRGAAAPASPPVREASADSEILVGIHPAPEPVNRIATRGLVPELQEA